MTRRTTYVSAALVALTAAGLLTAVAAPSGATPAPARAAVGTITWGRCPDASARKSGLQCAMLKVPLDYAHPNGAKISLALSRAKHTVPAARYQGVMLVNPGGPGGSGRYLSTLGSYVPNHVGGDYDWIGFDPRGVGASRPAISCQNNYFSFDRPDYIPTTKADLSAWMTRTKNYDQACAAKNGPLLNHMTTIDSARDMNSIRIALGVQKISYYGFSYGTYLGQVFSTLFPNRVRRMVLDSNVDPTRIWYLANLDQDYAFNRNIKIWFRWLAEYHGTYHLGATEQAVEKAWYAIRAKLTAKAQDGIGGDEWTDIFLNAGYYQSTWLDEAKLFANYVHKHAVAALRPAFLSADGLGNDNEFAVYNAVQCSDVQWPTSWAKWQADNQRVNKQAPFETWSNAWFNAPCLFWPAKPHKPVKVDGSKVASTLLIDETLDAATPYSGSLKVRQLYPHSSLIALPGGTSHANSLDGDKCLDDKIALYLATGALPERVAGNRADTTCAPLPVPKP